MLLTSPPVMQSPRRGFHRQRIYDVGLNPTHFGLPDKSKVLLMNLFPFGRAQPFHSPTVTRTQNHRPPILRRLEIMSSGFGLNLQNRNVLGGHQLAECIRIGYPVPGIEAFVEFRTNRADGVPKGSTCGFEESWSPRRDSKLAAWAHKLPQFTYRSLHVGDEEDTKHTNDRVEASRGLVKIEQIAGAKVNVLEPLLVSFAPRQLQ